MIAAHWFDGMICITNCDKIVPGMLMATMRVNIPTVFVSGGPMKAGATAAAGGRSVERVRGGRRAQGRQDSIEELAELEPRLPGVRLVLRHVYGQLDELPVRGAGHGAAGQRHDPGGGRAPRGAGATRRAADHTLIDKNLCPRDIVTAQAIDNAFALDMAMGGSTNTVLHALARRTRRAWNTLAG